jgi:hypothetical protein
MHIRQRARCTPRVGGADGGVVKTQMPAEPTSDIASQAMEFKDECRTMETIDINRDGSAITVTIAMRRAAAALHAVKARCTPRILLKLHGTLKLLVCADGLSSWSVWDMGNGGQQRHLAGCAAI